MIGISLCENILQANQLEYLFFYYFWGFKYITNMLHHNQAKMEKILELKYLIGYDKWVFNIVSGNWSTVRNLIVLLHLRKKGKKKDLYVVRCLNFYFFTKYFKILINF